MDISSEEDFSLDKENSDSSSDEEEEEEGGQHNHLQLQLYQHHHHHHHHNNNNNHQHDDEEEEEEEEEEDEGEGNGALVVVGLQALFARMSVRDLALVRSAEAVTVAQAEALPAAGMALLRNADFTELVRQREVARSSHSRAKEAAQADETKRTTRPRSCWRR